MDLNIMKKEGFKIIGKSTVVSTEAGNQFEELPLFWDKNVEEGICNKLAEYASELGVMGVMFDYSEKKQEMKYMIAIESPANSPAELEELELDEMHIPASTWAIFTGDLPLTELGKIYEEIYEEWLPGSDYQHAYLPELETYDVDQKTGEIKGYKIWIPIKEK